MGQNKKDLLYCVLDQVEWPEPSPDLFASTMRRVREEVCVVPKVPFFVTVIQRPAFLAACFALFLGVGILSGVQAQNILTDNTDYSYYSAGSAYFLQHE